MEAIWRWTITTLSNTYRLILPAAYHFLWRQGVGRTVTDQGRASQHQSPSLADDDSSTTDEPPQTLTVSTAMQQQDTHDDDDGEEEEEEEEEDQEEYLLDYLARTGQIEHIPPPEEGEDPKPYLDAVINQIESVPGLMDLIDRHMMPPPPSADRDPRLDLHTCSFCGRTSTQKLDYCGRCKKQAYCNKTCQTKHWKQGHKQQCVPVDQLSQEDMIPLPLTWKQLEEFEVSGSSTKRQKLEVSVVSTEQSNEGTFYVHCRDRDRVRKRVQLPAGSQISKDICRIFHNRKNLQIVPVLVWKRPRYRFNGGDDNVKILQEDLDSGRITVQEHQR